MTAIEPQVDTNTRNLKVRARVPNPKGELLPGVFATVRITQGEPRQYITLPNAAVAYNPYGATVFIVKDEGKGPDGKPQLVAEQRFVTAGPTRGDQVAHRQGREGGRNGGHRRPAQAAQRLADPDQQQREAYGQPESASAQFLNALRTPEALPDMDKKFTDIFIERPVLATVVSLVILVLGLRSVGLLPVLQYPYTQNAVVTVSTAYPGRRCEPGGELHHDAAGERDRPGQRHRLHDVVERAGGEHDHRQPAPELRPRQGAHRDQHQGQLGAEPAAAAGAEAGAVGVDRPDDRCDVHRLLQRCAEAQPDHRLPGPRGAAKAAGDRRRADRRDPRAPRTSRCAPGSIRRSSPPTA